METNASVNEQKICFVIMGFGKKTDYRNERTLDLDKTFENIISPAVEANGFQCIRADAIKESGLIDKSMYALLIMADLVIADISTYNPNALYELGIRHAAKPYSTIILKDNNENEKIPFDLDHNRMFMYKHLGEDIGATESKRCIGELSELIRRVISTPDTDSPLYEFWKSVTPLSLTIEEYNNVVNRLINKNDSLLGLTETARSFMKEKKFSEAADVWQKASIASPSEIYYIQQEALCVYKSEKPDTERALYQALAIIEKDTSMDIETLSIKAAIYKNLYKCSGEESHLENAIDLYNKAYVLSRNYYPGENYAICLLMMGIGNQEDKKHYVWQAREVCQDIISDWTNTNKDIDKRIDRKWIYATLANCFRVVNDDQGAISNEILFKKELPDTWELDTYNETKNIIAESKKKTTYII